MEWKDMYSTRQTQPKYRYLIIGAGAAGVSAVEAIRSLDPNGEILQVTDEEAGYYSRPGLGYYLSGEISEDCLFPFSAQDFRRLKVCQEQGQVKRVIPQEHQVVLENGKNISYNRLLIATGAEAAAAKVPGYKLEGVVKLDNLKDAQLMLKFAGKRKTAVVIGGGITALELVEGFRARGLMVHYFLRGERYWPNVLDETESHIVEQRLKEEGIQIHYRTELAEISGKGGKVSGVVTTEGKKINCDMVGIAIGIQPRKNLAEEAGLTTRQGILVNEYLNTSEVDIFAAGDAAEVYYSTLGKTILESLWGPARKQGTIAGLNMAGKKVAYHKGIPFNVTRLAGLTTTIIGAIGRGKVDADTVGIVRGDSEGWRKVPDALVAQADFDINRLRLLVGENHLVGGLVMGDQTLSRVIHQLVMQKVDISPIREKLVHPHEQITDVIADFWAEIDSPTSKREHAIVQS
jgi:NADPH-dependent 2,4-dienoyl-CoA reductase/sulfur reductase-like enzyme